MPSRTRPQESHTPQVDLKFSIPAGKDNLPARRAGRAASSGRPALGCLARIGAGGPETGRADGRAAEVLRACAVYFPRSAITYAPVAESIPFHIPSLYCMFQIAALKLGNWFVSILTGAAILENGLRETCADHIPTSRIPFRTLALRCGIDLGILRRCVEAVRKVEIRVVCGFPSAVGKSVLWTFPRSGFSTAFRRWASRDCSSAAANLLLPRLSGGLSFTTSIGRSGRRNPSDGRRHRDRWFAPRAHLAIALPPGMIRCLGSGRLGLLGRGLASSYGLNWNRAGNLFPSHRPTAIANL